MQISKGLGSRLCALATLLLANTACLAQGASDEASARLRTAKTWGYQLQKLEPGTIAATPFDVLVVDYSRDGSDEGALTAAEVKRLQMKPDGTRRVVLAYMSIGEAEEYRFYWKWYWGYLWGLLAPSWRSDHNAEWKGNYAVRYWSPDWQKIILGPDDSYMSRILTAGFDGVYLDKIDSSVEKVAKGSSNARGDMIEFVRRIAERGRTARPGFLVVPQNGDELLPDAGYRRVIDGLAKEDLLYGEQKDKVANRAEIVEARLRRLKLLTAEGKPVLAVEYLDRPDLIASARQQLDAAGFVPYFADRALDRLRVAD